MTDLLIILNESHSLYAGCGTYVFISGGGGGRSSPLYKPYKYVPSQRVGFLNRFGLKTGIDFAHFRLESGLVYEGTTVLTVVCQCVRRFNSK